MARITPCRSQDQTWVRAFYKYLVATGLSVLSPNMNDHNTNQATDRNDDLTPVELAHSIIDSLLDHIRVVSDLIAVMAQALDEDTQRALTQTAQWQAYLESRRRMETTRGDVEKFAAILTKSPVD